MNDPGQAIQRGLQEATGQIDLSEALAPRGVVQRVGDGVAHVVGLENVGYEELLQFDSGALGMAYDLGLESTGVVLLSQAERVREGDGVRGRRRLPEVPVGWKVLGRVIDPLGNPLDEGPRLPDGLTLPLFRPAPEIIERKSVDETLWTGVMAIDAAIPIGRGQRELIIGDRNVGKTSLAIDIVAAQQPGDVACVYVVIGQPISRVQMLRRTLDHSGCLDNTAIIAADASSSPGMQYLAPYAGASVAEWFRTKGRHALVIYDDLTKHADAYRELALLLDRPPGREAYPGDIFYVHAELLERAAARSADVGDGSVTALPLIETTDGDISSYIPTNLISITDGQIYLDSGRFERNQRPAIDVGRSVSRIGGVAQSRLMRKAARNLKIQISQFEALESLTRVGLEMDVGTRGRLARGRLLRELLRQNRLDRRDQVWQVTALLAVDRGWLEEVPAPNVRMLVERIVEAVRGSLPRIAQQLARGEVPTGPWEDQLANIVVELRREFVEAKS